MSTSSLELKNLTKRYNNLEVVHPMNVSIPSGQFCSILGPSGCGKTTTLMMLAGIEQPSSGEIWLDGDNITQRPLEKRGIGIVFQNYALFPNLTVRENILYGLYGRCSDKEKQERFSELIAMTHLEGMDERYPCELSGGQQQRVAIARALAPRPKLLLLDEPLSALDAWTRSSIGNELRDIQQKSGVTTVMVTHDRGEALALSDYILVMNKGTVEQAGTPTTIYDTPTTEFVATFVGGMNIVRLSSINNGEPTGIRFGDVQVFQPTESILGQDYTYVGQVESIDFLGDTIRVHLLLNDFKTRLIADVSRIQPVAKALRVKSLCVVQLVPRVWRHWRA